MGAKSSPPSFGTLKGGKTKNRQEPFSKSNRAGDGPSETDHQSGGRHVLPPLLTCGIQIPNFRAVVMVPLYLRAVVMLFLKKSDSDVNLADA